MTGQSSPREALSHLNTSSGSRGKHCPVSARGTPWLIRVQTLRQKLKATLAAMPPLGPVCLIGKTGQLFTRDKEGRSVLSALSKKMRTICKAEGKGPRSPGNSVLQETLAACLTGELGPRGPAELRKERL